MGLTRRLYERFRMLIHEVAKFGAVGGIAFVVTEVGTNVLHFQLHVGPITSNVIATIVATVVSYVGNRYWTFRHRVGMTSVAGEYTLFFVLNATGLLIQLACIGFTYYALGLTDKLSYNVALFTGIALGTLFRFWSYRKWVWRAHPAGPEATADGNAPVAPPAPGAGCPGPGQVTSSPAQSVRSNGHAAHRAGATGPLPHRQTRDMTGPGAPRGR
ncbi:MAG TPA: GtrA family protein [Streptosporangiaceae bacterium]|nr:GtrA family protein [Streptosporangiaceae bacterium]